MKINGTHIKRSVGETVRILEKEKEFLNNMNVFPVADGDTGTNLYTTLKGVWDGIRSVEDWRASVVAQAVAEHSLLHAKGNSGVILSQFFWGFREGVDGKTELGVKDVAVALGKGAEYAYKAVANPVEGTILTIMRETAHWASRFVNVFHDTRDFFQAIFRKGVEALKRTPELLSRMGKPRVIDSGAYGFTLFLEGFLRSLNVGVSSFRVRGVKVERESGKGNLYCSNFLVSGVEEYILKRLASKYGDSVVVVGKDGVYKVHVHTYTPERLEAELSRLGKVLQRRVEPIW